MSSSDKIAYIITPSGKRRPVRRGGLERKALLSDPVKRDKLIRKADPGMVEVKGKKRRKKLSPKEASIRRYYARVLTWQRGTIVAMGGRRSLHMKRIPGEM
ncbi:hypothetical protein BUE64_05145 [Corynebacterium diphtheriae subsp. lausannense]|nr:hypothetical protein BUE64_05145 [Corynebacterium diphtheriae subsp. lausannense]